MSPRDNARYGKALIKEEIPTCEKISQRLKEKSQLLKEEIDQLKESRDKKPTPEHPVEARNAKFFDDGAAIVIALYEQRLKLNDLFIETAKDMTEALRILENINSEKSTEEEMRRAFTDVSKISVSLEAKESVQYRSFKAFMDASEAFIRRESRNTH